MNRLFGVFAVLAMLFASSIVFAQYGYGGGSSQSYPDCATCPSGTYVSNNAPTYWNCYGSGALCTYTGVSTTSSILTTTIAPPTQNATQNATVNSTAVNSTPTSTVITTVTTLPSTTVSQMNYPDCNTCPSGTYYSTNAPTYWNCYGTGALCTYTGSTSGGYGGLIGYALMAIVALVGLFFISKMKALPTRLVIVGTALILIGTVSWLLGDYGSPASYVLYGIGAIALGTLVWLYGDIVGGTFKNKKAGMFVGIGVLLIVIGTLVWIYVSSATGIWAGAGAIVVGTAIWLYADKIVGAFVTGKK